MNDSVTISRAEYDKMCSVIERVNKIFNSLFYANLTSMDRLPSLVVEKDSVQPGASFAGAPGVNNKIQAEPCAMKPLTDNSSGVRAI